MVLDFGNTAPQHQIDGRQEQIAAGRGNAVANAFAPRATAREQHALVRARRASLNARRPEHAVHLRPQQCAPVFARAAHKRPQRCLRAPRAIPGDARTLRAYNSPSLTTHIPQT
eukprot:2383530-Lingulodinium_polyedra.AAC.1